MPKISERTFIAPGGVPIRKTPSIKDIIETPKVPEQPVPPQTSSIPDKPIEEPDDTTPAQQPSEETTTAKTTTTTQEETVSEETTTAEATTQEETVSEVDIVAPRPEVPSDLQAKNSPEEFPTLWGQMFTDLFGNNPMIYFPLKDIIPIYQDRIIHAEVLNDFQKDEYERKKRDILEYWRNHFDLEVEDIVITVNKNIQIKKVIYSTDDKLQNLEEQNPQLRDFLNIINFKIKD